MLGQSDVPQGKFAPWDHRYWLLFAEIFLEVREIENHTEVVPAYYAPGTAAHLENVLRSDMLVRYFVKVERILSFLIEKDRLYIVTKTTHRYWERKTARQYLISPPDNSSCNRIFIMPNETTYRSRCTEKNQNITWTKPDKDLI